MNVPETLWQAFETVTGEYPDSIATIDTARVQAPRLTFAELADEVASASAFLKDRLKVGCGDVICNWLPNLPEWIVLQLAASRLGVLTVNLNTRSRGYELADMLRSSKAVGLVLPTGLLNIDFAGVAREVLGASTPGDWKGQWPYLRAVVAVDASEDPSASALGRSDDLALIDWRSSVAEYCAPDGRIEGEGHADDLVTAFATSGTTGTAKLAVHKQSSLVQHAKNVAREFDIRDGDRLLAALPLCGAFGFTGAMSALLAGAGLVLQPVFNGPDAVRWFRDEGVTHAYGPDTLLRTILDAADDRTDLASWRGAAFADFSGGGSEVAKRIESELGVRARGVYGASELFAFVSFWPREASTADRHQGGGRPVASDIAVRAVDPEDGTILGNDRDGALEFRGYPVMVGYLGNEEATASAFTEDGWFRSGDVGRTRSDGSFVYLGRLGDSLRLRGFLVDPAEIETILLSHAQVRAAAVVGVQRPGSGDAAVAFVEGDPAIGSGDLLDYCRARVAGFKIPTHIVRLDALPRTTSPNGSKIQRHELRKRAYTLVDG